MIIENITDFDTEQTLDCGQAFRWRELEDGSFKGVAFGRLVTFQKDDEKIIFGEILTYLYFFRVFLLLPKC